MTAAGVLATARHAGQCARCVQPIDPGALIARDGDTWNHATCVPGALPRRSKAERRAWWASLTEDEQTAYIAGKMAAKAARRATVTPETAEHSTGRVKVTGKPSNAAESRTEPRTESS